MALPKEYRAFRRTKGALPHTVELSNETLPSELAAKDVLIKIHAVSLNYRDVAMLDGKYPVPVEERGIPASDCAAEVVAIGSDVKDFKEGDHVAPLFDLGTLTGFEDGAPGGLGGDTAGVLREYAVFDEKVLVRLPKHLSWEEASTLSCAGVTAWNALNWPASLETSRSVLLQGTGGVSIFALILARAAGIMPIMTSSSDEKLAQIERLCPETKGLNYRKTTDQVAEIARLTDGKMVDVVVNNSGPGSLITDIKSLRTRGGVVSLVGFLDGLGEGWQPGDLINLMIKGGMLKAIRVGSKVDYERLNSFLEEKEVHLEQLLDRTYSDRTFSFEESAEAFQYLYSGKHVGKVVITL